jgi:hypothetical protein
MTKQELKKLIKQVLNENQTDRGSMVGNIIDKIATEIRANPLYKNVTTSKFGENMVGYLKNGYRVAFIIDDPNKIRVQLYDKNDNFISKKIFNKIEDVIEASKNPMLLLQSGEKVNIPGLDGAQVVRTMKNDGKVFIQLSDGKTIWDAVLI